MLHLFLLVLLKDFSMIKNKYIDVLTGAIVLVLIIIFIFVIMGLHMYTERSFMMSWLP